MQNNKYVVIMAGGSGTRLWPMSREGLPKQLHSLASEKSLLQETYERVKNLVPKENIYVSLVKKVLHDSQKQLPHVEKDNFIVEPLGKNTGPAIALVASHIFKKDPQGIVITIASDHVVTKPSNFEAAVKTAFNFVEENPDYFTTIGLSPTRPDTGLGYIKVGRKFENLAVHEVEKFVEKPNLEKAEAYLKSGDYLWNASYFIFRADKLLALYAELAPEIYQNIREMLPLIGDKTAETKIESLYEKMPKEAIDTAIAEKATKVAVVKADLGWSDVGSWATLFDLLSAKHGQANVSRGNHLGLDDKNCLIYAQDKLLATLGLEDIVIVDTPDVTLVCNINRSQDVKLLIEKLKSEGKEHYL